MRSARREEPQRVQLEHGSPFAEQAGVRTVAIDEGRATLTLPVGPTGPTETGTVHRGTVTVLVEAAAVAAALGPGGAPERPEGTSELYVSFVRAAPEAPLHAEARVVGQAGRRRNCEVEVRDWNGDLVAKGFLRCEV